ncbi:MAG: endonuclease/exonuclease/phosphatase family protein [Pseudomonadota bacterium]
MRDVTAMKLFRIVVGLLLACATFGVWFGFAGGLHPIGDALSLFRIVLGAVCLMGCLWSIGWALRSVLFATGAAALITTIPMFWPDQGTGDLTIYSKNLWYRNGQLDAVAADMRQSGAEVIALQEVSAQNERVMAALRDAYPYQHLCAYGVAVLSKYPIAAQTCSEGRGIAAAQIDRSGQRVWIGSVHLPWPFPFRNARGAAAAQDVIENLDGPIVLAGDFNIFPWANSVRQLQRSAGAMPAQPIRPTFSLKGAPLFLDHVHAPGGGTVTYRGLIGSDHLGVLARVRLQPH